MRLRHIRGVDGADRVRWDVCGDLIPLRGRCGRVLRAPDAAACRADVQRAVALHARRTCGPQVSHASGAAALHCIKPAAKRRRIKFISSFFSTHQTIKLLS